MDTNVRTPSEPGPDVPNDQRYALFVVYRDLDLCLGSAAHRRLADVCAIAFGSAGELSLAQ